MNRLSPAAAGMNGQVPFYKQVMASQPEGTIHPKWDETEAHVYSRKQPWSGQGLSEATDGITPACSGPMELCPAEKSRHQSTEPWPPRLGNPCSSLLFHDPNLTSQALLVSNSLSDSTGTLIRQQEYGLAGPPGSNVSFSVERWPSRFSSRLQGCWKN